MVLKNLETCKINTKESFTLNVLKLLSSTCHKHIHELSEEKHHDRDHCDPNSGSQNEDIDHLSHIISSLLYDFSTNLQGRTTLFSPFEVIQKSCDSIKSKLDAINYSKWNRVYNKKYKNVYHKLYKRGLDPTYRRTSEDSGDGMKILFNNFQRKHNIWAHQVLYDDCDVDKPYNEPPQVQVIKFDVTGDVIITGGSEGIIKFWNSYTFKSIMSIKKHSGAINCIDVHPTNSFIASCCEGGELWLWEISNNFYRPHKMIKNTYKFLWVKFLVNSHNLDCLIGDDGHSFGLNIKNLKDKYWIHKTSRIDYRDRLNWEKIIDSTLIVSVDANSVLRVYKLSQILSSSSGENVYTDITPFYYVDLFNHNITAYDLSKCSFNGTFLTAIGIEPLDAQDFENADFDDINTALNYIKNDSFHKTNLNIKGKYRDLIGKSGFALLKIPFNDPHSQKLNLNLDNEPCYTDPNQTKKGFNLTNSTNIDEFKFCTCDLPIDLTSNCVRCCLICGKFKNLERTNSELSISHYEGSDGPDTNSCPKSMFVWVSENSSEIEKFFNELIPQFNFVSHSLFDSYTPNMPTMHYGKMSSSLILPAYFGSGRAHEKESGDFDRLFLNFVKDAHILSPDVCFANTSTNHISASDDGKIFLWSYDFQGFKSKQLKTKTMEKWKVCVGGRIDGKVDVKSVSSGDTKGYFKDYGGRDRKNKDDDLDESEVDVKTTNKNKKNYTMEQSKMSTNVTGKKDGQTEQQNILYVVVALSWSTRDKYVCVADSLVTRYNYKKVITQARTNVSGLSFFNSDGKRISDFLHDSLSYHVSSVSFNPVSEEICVASTYDGLVVLLDVLKGIVIKKMSFGTTSVWLDMQWHPMGHQLVASQKYGCFSVFTGCTKELGDENVPNYQSIYSDYYCNTLNYSTSAYLGPESNSTKIKKYYSNFTNIPIKIDDNSTYERIYNNLNGGTVVFLDEYKNNVVIHTSGNIKRYPFHNYYSFNEKLHVDSTQNSSEDLEFLYSIMCKLNGFNEYFEAHYTNDQNGNINQIIKQFLHLMRYDVMDDEMTNSNPLDSIFNFEDQENLEIDIENFVCYLGECSVCENYINIKENNQKYLSLKDSTNQLKTVTDKNGLIIKSIPPSSRPQDFVDTTMTERHVTPPRRIDYVSSGEAASSSSSRSRVATDEGVMSRYIQDSIILDNNVAFESNSEVGSLLDTLQHSSSNITPSNNLNSVLNDQLSVHVSSNQKNSDRINNELELNGDRADAEITLDVDSNYDDDDFEIGSNDETDEELDSEEYDTETDSEDFNIRRSTRIALLKLNNKKLKKTTNVTLRSSKKQLENRELRNGTPTRITRSSVKLNGLSKNLLSEDELGLGIKSYSNDDYNKLESIEYTEEHSVDSYNFRCKRKYDEINKNKEINSIHNLSLTMGPLIVSYKNYTKEYIESVCIFCGLGQKEYYNKMTRNQSSKLGSTLFSRGSKFNPGSKLFKNLIVGPINIPKRYHSYLEEYTSITKRIESYNEIYVHISCLLTSQIKIDNTSKLLNFPEILTKSSYNDCKFCNTKYATVQCIKCDSFYHYPCSIACYNDNFEDTTVEQVINKWDSLICNDYMCIECSTKYELDYVTSKCFLKSDSRQWLMSTNDSYNNKFNVQIGDYVLLFFCDILESYEYSQDYPKIYSNIHLKWLFNNESNYLLIKILSMNYVFKNNNTVVCSLLVESVFNNNEQFCIFLSPKNKLILLRDFLWSIYKLVSLQKGSLIKHRIRGEIIESQIVSFKNGLCNNDSCNNIDNERNIYRDTENTKKEKVQNLDDLKLLIDNSYQLGYNSINVEVNNSKSKTMWINSWDLCFDVDIDLDIKTKTFPEIDKNSVMELLGDERFEPFYLIEESGVGSHSWISEYWRTIPRPIWKKEIIEKLFNGYYRTSEGIFGDLNLLIENSLTFNPKASQYHKLAKELESILKELREQLSIVEEWKVVVECILPKLNQILELQTPNDSSSSCGLGTSTSSKVKKSENKNTSVQQYEKPIRRSSRIQENVKKTKEVIKERKSSRYNLR